MEFYGWDGERLAFTQSEANQWHMIYEPESFTQSRNHCRNRMLHIHSTVAWFKTLRLLNCSFGEDLSLMQLFLRR